MDLTKLMKGPAEAEPVQEQPKLSREEYAAQKKAEREELWTRIDALTVDAFKDGSSLRGFLDFTAQNPCAVFWTLRHSVARSELRTCCCSTATRRRPHG